MILYLIKSTLCLGVLLIFYKWLLEDVAIHRFKRFFLLFALVISIIAPILPTGLPHSSNEVAERILFVEGASSFEEIPGLVKTTWTPSFPNILLGISLFGSMLFFARFIRNINQLIQKTYTNKTQKYKRWQLVLLEETLVPHTFLNMIFLNKKEFVDGKIDPKLLAHEEAHADQRHSWDVIFIEILICIFWFNPLLRIYKKAMQLNHEFLADQAVLQEYHQVKKYQHLLLDVIKNNNPISLASSINFHLTKKRLEMMTKHSTVRQKVLLPLSIFPLTLILLIAFGRPATAQNSQKDMEVKTENKVEEARDAYFKDAIVHYKTHDGNVMIKSYNSLPITIKNIMPPPPPLPPTISGEKRAYNFPSPLEKGTIVSLTEGGSIKIGNGANNLIPPPPPVPQVKDLANQGMSIYLNGGLVLPSVAKTICEPFNSKTMLYKIEKDGKKALYITTDQ